MRARWAVRGSAIDLAIALGVWVCSATCPMSLAQGVDASPSSGNDLANNSEKISIYVEVTDKSENPISGLAPADFKVFDNNHEEKIIDFSATDASHPDSVQPQIQVIIDAVNSGPVTVAQARDGVSAFLRQNSGELNYATSIWALENEGLKQIATPSKDTSKLLAALNGSQSPLRVINRSAGVWGDLERIDQAISLMKQMVAPNPLDCASRNRVSKWSAIEIGRL